MLLTQSSVGSDPDFLVRIMRSISRDLIAAWTRTYQSENVVSRISRSSSNDLTDGRDPSVADRYQKSSVLPLGGMLFTEFEIPHIS